MKLMVNRHMVDLAQPWVIGFRRPLFTRDFWQYLDLDTQRQPERP